ncbi:patatin-like phospholipase family protein [Streptomyces sp. TRM 70351]|uniref:patatin-like phospholipase family protein n=1 Tax=Streptomyces sp. TRM 70351 TaxID=3116552 RepID=UPI002E7AF492|nr:patatin-like phospholipase family protein [Streptomyces sp. TRM 70351]MEE1927530.1 patatin-like phospholipase family protein [Streptomyces sp. TRM 70351]
MEGSALVLGGGGLTGIGWEAGLLAGLAGAGVDLTTADHVIGTSAGSVVGAQFTSGACTPDELYERQLVDPAGETFARLGPAVLTRWALAALRSRDPRRFRARLGRMALDAPTPPEAERRAVIAGRLLSHRWPGRPALHVTAVDARTGEFRAFGAASGVDVVDAVTASCAVPGVWPPATIAGRRWIDGGVRSGANADLARGCARVVILAPMAGGAGPLVSVRAQAERLAADGARVAVVTPDAASRAAFGRNMLDPARRAAAARAGRAQAAAHARAVAAVWHG